MDSKPLLQDRPPAYSPADPGGCEYGHPGYGPQNYGTIPGAPQSGPPPPPYPYPPRPTATGSGFIATPHLIYPPGTCIIQQQPSLTSVVVVGGCPACRVGVLEDSFTCLGIFCAVFFFPIGILFCFALRQRRCPNCGATFG
ncbi:membrane protein BRI3 [Anomaloglossus baeobatrachus]|uniref:membrane protein BRI3 n=1 Tax=Anomaloglossus baeobatrachus TaxID=238106 RepID=UPI003F4FB026